MVKKILLILLLPFLVKSQSVEQKKMQWFKDAKLGIFIHWGLYSVNGISESWAFYNGQISHNEYMKQIEGFTAKNYNPDYWAKLIKESGAKYSVITSKHHEGFALWDTKFGKLNSMNSAARKDVLTPFVNALKENDLKVGIYYSLPDWSYLDYTDHTRKIKRYKIEDEPKRWDKFLNYYQGQLAELRDNYNPNLWWFDGDWEHNEKEWEVDKIKSLLREDNENVLFNSRLCGNGDYKTPEIGMPVTRPETNYWELCVTMNDSWGYYPSDKNYKTPKQVIDLFVDCISKGGNLLLNIGPKADGTIPKEQVTILQELGKWTNKHKETIYTTVAGIPYDHFYGPTALSKDSSILYLYVRDIPKDERIILKGIENQIEKITIVGEKGNLQQQMLCKVSWNKYPGVIYIDIPKEKIDNYYTVIEVQLEGKVNLYRENTGAIECN
ncbi:MAG: alpha-L-fucosidase [Flavobacteriales bacterium]|jgi:alpha-L-fucosidase|nr:alpha-L-fucosidase [Flavobacteriales bacterium]MBT5089671.1 alpha-L-fucosidase [Flavobacteriales bacterium]MBT5750082.1 alpha-L-fucosidase [Flavobacteriales bacterium]